MVPRRSTPLARVPRMASSDPAGDGTSHGVSRRTALAGGLGLLGAAAVAVPATAYLRQDGRTAGRTVDRVAEMLHRKPFYVAHGGGSADWPPLSMEAYRRSVARGVQALEVSLARSADGVWFGLHDATLDRTSGTKGFTASAHSWAEISSHRISGAGTRDPGQPAQPYLRFEELARAYAGNHVLFVDPKAVDRRHYPELLALMAAATARPTAAFVAKGYCTTTPWADAAHAAGYRTWGYYYGRSIDDGSTPLARTQASWDLVGLDVDASAAAWAATLATGKPVVAHIVRDAAQARAAVGKGAAGLMVSGVLEVVGAGS
jgi:Glycerophosphoryl diester phosphodiesterase family